ncbi:hypothetical protein [Actinoplanes sp. NPDC023714]|uniref:hypothetical protein n=1 Tax=Actinoplanes sp. NPDC023714 TaxID=3154322 RepID=UPI00340CF4D9
MFHPANFFDVAGIDVGRPLGDFATVWEILGSLPELVDTLLGSQRIIKGSVARTAVVDDGPVYIAENATIEPGVYVKGPAYIGPGVTIRHGAYVREACVFLDGSLLGHASEAKNALFLPGAKAPHFAYVGDSILGRRVNLGAGTKLSNLPIVGGRQPDGRRRSILIPAGGKQVDTGLSKLGAVLGDDVEVGCNAVLNPGVVVGPRSLIYPNATLRKGLYSAATLFKLRQTIDIDERK